MQILTQARKIHPKIFDTALLPKVKGSLSEQIAKANETAKMVCDDIYIKSNGTSISLKEIKEIVRPYAPNIDFEISPLNKLVEFLGCGGKMNTNRHKGASSGYRIDLPVSKAKVQLSKIDNVGHELTHFFLDINSPKYTVKDNCIVINKLINQEKVKELSTTILPATILAIAGEPGLGIIAISIGTLINRFLSKKTKPILEFYKNSLYSKTKIDSKELRETAENILKNSNLNSNQKIDLLQFWRHRIKDEQNAYKNGIEIANPDDDFNKLCNFDPNTEIEVTYRFSDKISMLEDLIKEEITKHRQQRRKTPSLNKE